MPLPLYLFGWSLLKALYCMVVKNRDGGKLKIVSGMKTSGKGAFLVQVENHQGCLQPVPSYLFNISG